MLHSACQFMDGPADMLVHPGAGFHREEEVRMAEVYVLEFPLTEKGKNIDRFETEKLSSLLIISKLK